MDIKRHLNSQPLLCPRKIWGPWELSAGHVWGDIEWKNNDTVISVALETQSSVIVRVACTSPNACFFGRWMLLSATLWSRAGLGE